MPVGQLVALRNKTRGVLVLTPDPSDPKAYLEFQAYEDPGGADYQYVSEQVAANSPPIVKAILHQILEMPEDTLSPDVQASFRQQMEVAQAQKARAAEAVLKSIERTEHRDLVGTPCVGPGTTSGTFCGQSVPVREGESRESAPLCPQHKGLAQEFVPFDDFDGEKHNVRWVRARLGERERGVA